MCDQQGCLYYHATTSNFADPCVFAEHPRWSLGTNPVAQGMIVPGVVGTVLYAGQYPTAQPDGSYFDNGTLYNSNGQIEQYGSNTWPQQAWVSAQAAGNPLAAPPQVVVSGSFQPMVGWTTASTYSNSNGTRPNEIPSAGDVIPRTRGSVVIGRYRTAEIPRTPTLPRLCCIDHKCDAKVHWWSYTENELVRSSPTGRAQNMHFWRAWIECSDQHMWITFFFPEKTHAIEFAHDETEAVDDVYEETAVLERLIDDYAERIKAQRKFMKKHGAG